MSWFRSQWEIKLLALVMAMSLYFYTSNQARSEVGLSVRPQLQDLPENLDVTDIEPGEFSIVVDAPVAMQRDLGATLTPSIPFDPSRLRQGVMTYDITEHLLQLDPNFRLVSSSSPRITITVDSRRERTLQVRVNIDDIELTVPGLRRIEAQAAVAQVLVEGSEKVLAKLPERLPIAKVVIDDQVDPGIVEPLTIRGLLLEPAFDLTEDERERIRLLGRERLTVDVTVAPVFAEHIVPLPLHLQATRKFLANYTFHMEEDSRPIKLIGPANKLAELALAEVTAYVRLPEDPDLDVDRSYPVRVTGPAWLSSEPTQVDVRISLRPRGSGGAETVPPRQPLPEP